MGEYYGYQGDQRQAGYQYDQDQPYQQTNEYAEREYVDQSSNAGYEYDPPTGAPEPENYQPTGAGYVPPGNQGYAAPYGPPPGQYTREAQYPAQQQRAQGPYFEYSRCTGRKKALLIGINYIGSENELEGCINDAHNVERFICERFGYDPSDIVILTDDAQDDRQYPSRANILRAMAWLVDGAERDDSLFFHYSGHGTQVPDQDGDEEDGFDEVNFDSAGVIIDDDREYSYRQPGLTLAVHDMLVKPLPPGCRLTAIFDSCHSGTVLDLPYGYSAEGTIKSPELLSLAVPDLKAAASSFIQRNNRGVLTDLFGAARAAWGGYEAGEMTRKVKTAPGDVVEWAGCKDSQTSADTEEAGRATGAMSYAFIAALTKYPSQSYQQLLVTIRSEMRARYAQKPQLSACHPIDVELGFIA